MNNIVDVDSYFKPSIAIWKNEEYRTLFDKRADAFNAIIDYLDAKGIPQDELIYVADSLRIYEEASQELMKYTFSANFLGEVENFQQIEQPEQSLVV